MLSLTPFIALPPTNAGFAEDPDVAVRKIEASLMKRLDEELGTDWRVEVSKRVRREDDDGIDEEEENDFRRGNVPRR
jgi:hypothetical protein